MDYVVLLVADNLRRVPLTQHMSPANDNKDQPIALVDSPFIYRGGAWKVAYADFVTAMMAFFLLLWLIASSSEETKEGLAEYFTPTIGLKDEMGIGLEGGISQTDDGVKRSDKAPPGIVEGRPQEGDTAEMNKQSMIEGAREAKLFEKAEAEMKQAMESDPNLRDYSDNIMFEQSPEGLKMTLQDDGRKAMYDAGTGNLSAFGQGILSAMKPLIEKLPNHISISGHTDAASTNRKGYSNWELSSDRAHAARRFLLEEGLDKEKTAKIVGRASHELLVPERPASPRNRRIEIILLKGSHLKKQPGDEAAPRAIITAPRANKVIDKYDRRIEKEVKAKKKAAEAAAKAETQDVRTNILDAIPE